MRNHITEQEASEKTCPLSKTALPHQRKCEGSKCMAWKWYRDDLGYCGFTQEFMTYYD